MKMNWATLVDYFVGQQPDTSQRRINQITGEELQVRYSRSRYARLAYRSQTLMRKTRTLHKQREGCATRKFKPIVKSVPPVQTGRNPSLAIP
jgi:hypothetical protein